MSPRVSKPRNNRKSETLPGIITDVSFFDDARVLGLIEEFGIAGVGFLFRLNCAIGKSPKALLDPRLLEIYIKQCKLTFEVGSAVVEWCLKFNLLVEIAVDGITYLSSDNLQSDLQALTVKRNHWRKYKGTSTRNPRGIQLESTEIPQQSSSGTNETPEEFPLNLNLNLNTEPQPSPDPSPQPEPEPKTKTPKNQHLTYVHLTEAEEIKVRTDFGEPFLKRCIEKLDAWIAQDPTPKRKRNGLNAAATFRSWVINSVAEEKSRAQKVNPTDLDTKIMEFLND